MPDNRSDRDLINAFKQSQSIFSELVSRYQKQIYRFALGVVANHHGAEELSQEAFVRLWKSLQAGTFDESRPIYPWLRAVCLNLCRDYLSGQKKQSGLTANLDLVPEPADCPESGDAGLQAENREIINQAIESLEPERRTVLTLRVVEGLSYKEISQQLNCSIGTVMSRLFRARTDLAVRLNRVKIDAGRLEG